MPPCGRASWPSPREELPAEYRGKQYCSALPPCGGRAIARSVFRDFGLTSGTAGFCGRAELPPEIRGMRSGPPADLLSLTSRAACDELM